MTAQRTPGEWRRGGRETSGGNWARRQVSKCCRPPAGSSMPLPWVRASLPRRNFLGWAIANEDKDAASPLCVPRSDTTHSPDNKELASVYAPTIVLFARAAAEGCVGAASDFFEQRRKKSAVDLAQQPRLFCATPQTPLVADSRSQIPSAVPSKMLENHDIDCNCWPNQTAVALIIRRNWRFIRLRYVEGHPSAPSANMQTPSNIIHPDNQLPRPVCFPSVCARIQSCAVREQGIYTLPCL